MAMSSSPQNSDTSELQMVSKLVFQNYQWLSKTAYQLQGYLTPFAASTTALVLGQIGLCQ